MPLIEKTPSKSGILKANLRTKRANYNITSHCPAWHVIFRIREGSTEPTKVVHQNLVCMESQDSEKSSRVKVILRPTFNREASNVEHYEWRFNIEKSLQQ